MTGKIERKPHVELITVKHLPEEYPELSYLGTFANVPKGKFVIDRSKLGHLNPDDYHFFNADNVSNMKEAMENYQRALSYGVSWSMFGIQAFVDVLVPLGKDSRPNDWMVQTIRSGGLWGIESDSDPSYVKEVESEQIEELKTQLRILGIDCSESVKVERPDE